MESNITGHRQQIININGEDVEIDIECIPMVELFNIIGLDTKFCCKGDSENYFNIMLEDYISDKNIIDFLKKFSNKYDHSPFLGKFVKWGRKMCGSIVFNWMYQCNNLNWVKHDYEIIKKEFVNK